MTYKKNVDNLKNVDITGKGIIYGVDAETLREEVSEEIFEQALDLSWYLLEEGEEILLGLSGADIEMLSIPENAVCRDHWFQADPSYIEEFARDLVKPSENYLVALNGTRWDGASGYRVVSDVGEIFDRGYDCAIYLTGSYRKGKILQTKEYHHDCPMGHTGYIIALTEKERERVEGCLGQGYGIAKELRDLLGEAS